MTQQWARAIYEDQPAGPGITGIHYRSGYNSGQALALWDCDADVEVVHDGAGHPQDMRARRPTNSSAPRGRVETAPNKRHHSAFQRLQPVQEGTGRPLTPPCVPGDRVAASAQHPTHRIHAPRVDFSFVWPVPRAGAAGARNACTADGSGLYGSAAARYRCLLDGVFDVSQPMGTAGSPAAMSGL